MTDRRFTFRSEAAAVAMALLVLMTAEVGARVVGTDSADNRDIDSVPARLDEAEDGGRLVVLLGNSTTREGYDRTRLVEELSDGDRVDVVAIHPDDTTVADWAAAQRFFLDDRDPDLVVISFVAGQVADGLPRHLSRLGSDFSTWGDLPDRLAAAGTVDDALEIISARSSTLYANRVEVADRVLGLLPGYRSMARRNNDAARRSDSVGAVDGCCTYEDLEELLRAIGPARAVVVALPDRAQTPMDDDLPGAVTGVGATFLDARHVPGIDAAEFADALHLDAEGRRLMTGWLAVRLAPMITD